jgi:hypothetical protein
MPAKLTASIFTMLAFSSCVFIPLPHMRLHHYGVKGQLVDAGSHRPIACAVIASPPSKHQFQSSAEGDFTVKPIYGWHGAYLFGVISQSFFPHLDMPEKQREIDVSAPGYQPKHVSFGLFTKFHPSSRSHLNGQTIEMRRK